MEKTTVEQQGTLRKMKTEYADPVRYFLNLNGSAAFEVNRALGLPFHLGWTGAINCINCGKPIRKTYGQGFCYDCFISAPEASPCIIRPELCEAHLGKGRDVEWEKKNHMQPHVVYLAQTSGIKVGITRSNNMPGRWIDQGARRIAVVAETPYRYLAGRIEVELKQYLTDRTDWRKMLIDERDEDDLEPVRARLAAFLPGDLAEYAVSEGRITELNYPVERYPRRVEAIPFEKVRRIDGTLTGIRGQYLYFNGDQVINMRKYAGYEVKAGF